MKPVRIWFRKEGSARYISHLDLTRCFSRAMHKAKIPLWYTEGFSPRAYMVFALPLSLGIRGERESLDIRLEQDMPPEELVSRLNAALPPDLPVFAVTDPVMKPGKIAFASFEFTLEPETLSCEEALSKIEDLLTWDDILVEKHSKTGPKLINLAPYLTRTKVWQEDGKLRISSILPAGSTENVNPYLITTAIRLYLGFDFYETAARTNLYDAGMTPFA